MSDDAPQTQLEPTAGLELRIVSGVHAGAKIVLPPPTGSGTATLSIGPGLDHDVVLSDAPGSAQLRLESGEWQWAEQDFRSMLRPGSGWKWGAILLGLATPGAGWSLPGTLLFDRPDPGAGKGNGDASPPSTAPDGQVSPDTQEGARAAGAETPASAVADSPRPSNDQDASPPPGTSSGGRGWLLAGGVVVTLMLLGGWLTLFSGNRPDDAPLANAAPAEPLTPSTADPSAVRAALSDAGLGQRVRVIPLADGRLRLSGVVADDDELDRAIAAVRPTTRRIVQGILTQKEFSTRVAELQAESPVPVTLRAAPVGRVLMVDADRPGVDIARLKDWLARVLPEALEVEAAQAARLAEAARSQPGPTMLPVPPVAPPAPVTAIAALPAVPPNEPPLPDLPDIRLVMGGTNPYVVLGSGEKWLPGGRVGGWYLAAIEARALILEDSLGRQLRSPR